MSLDGALVIENFSLHYTRDSLLRIFRTRYTLNERLPGHLDKVTTQRRAENPSLYTCSILEDTFFKMTLTFRKHQRGRHGESDT